MKRVLPFLVAPLAGALWALPFDIEPAPIAAWIAFAPLLVLLGGRAAGSRSGAFVLGWLHGLSYWWVAIPWIIPTLTEYGGLGTPIAVFSLFLLAGYLALYTGLFALFGAPLWRRGGLFAFLGLPALWVALEWVRGWLFSGFPWNLAAYAWTDLAGALPLAAWVGPWGVSALLIFANVGLARAAALLLRPGASPATGDRRTAWRPAAVGVMVPLLVLSLAGRFAGGPRQPLGEPRVADAGSPVRLVQPDIYNQTSYDAQMSADNYQRLLRLSDQACDLPGSLVIWPESATWPYEYRREAFHTERVEGFTRDRGCPLLLNSTTRTDDGLLFNSVYLVADGQATGRYDKRNLVPFGEYVPLKDVFSFLERIARASGDYDAADQVTLLPWGAQKLGVAICFEVTYPGATAELVRHGATTLVTVTNDAWYGDSSAPRQHFRAAQWRAAETRRPLLRAAITGISGVVGPDGTVRDRMEVGEEGVLATRVLGRTDLTPFVRAPWLPPLSAGLVAVFAIILTARRPAIGRRPDVESPHREEPARPAEQPGDTTP